MLLLMSIFIGLVVTALRYADLPIGQALHAALIVAPAAWLTRTPLQQVVIALLLLFGASVLWSELGPLLMATDYSPVLWFADMSLYLDALLTVTVAATVVHARSVGRLASGRLRGAVLGACSTYRRRRARSSGPRLPKRSPPADEDAPGFVLCMAA